MPLELRKAVRENVYSKIALMGPSGAGKTYSALRLATGMAQELEKVLGRKATILMINSEKTRGIYYANEFDYFILPIDPPYEPEKYIQFISDAVDAKVDILILDSTSPEWEGRGGCLEIQQLAGGRYQDWGKVTPRHDKFLLAIAESPIHIIATMRGKDQYELEKDEKGHAVVTKLGVGAKQRDGFEYEFTLTFSIDQKDSHAVTQKDNTHLFEKAGRVLLSENDGIKIIQWANSGEGYTPKVYKESQLPENAMFSKKKEIVELCKTLGGQSNEKVMETVKKFTPDGKANPNSITDESKLDELKIELLSLQSSAAPAPETK